MTKPTHSTLWILLALLLAAGCTSMGTGYGTTAAGTNPVRFDWKSSDDVSGTMYATLADGSVYAGSYFQITDTTTADTLGPLWDGWGSGWGFVQLVHPSSGMAGGGQGDCQLPDGKTINTSFSGAS